MTTLGTDVKYNYCSFNVQFVHPGYISEKSAQLSMFSRNQPVEHNSSILWLQQLDTAQAHSKF